MMHNFPCSIKLMKECLVCSLSCERLPDVSKTRYSTLVLIAVCESVSHGTTRRASPKCNSTMKNMADLWLPLGAIICRQFN